MSSRKIIVPQGLINPNETTIIEIPPGVDSEATLIARLNEPRRMVNSPAPKDETIVHRIESFSVIEETAQGSFEPSLSRSGNCNLTNSKHRTKTPRESNTNFEIDHSSGSLTPRGWTPQRLDATNNFPSTNNSRRTINRTCDNEFPEIYNNFLDDTRNNPTIDYSSDYNSTPKSNFESMYQFHPEYPNFDTSGYESTFNSNQDYERINPNYSIYSNEQPSFTPGNYLESTRISPNKSINANSQILESGPDATNLGVHGSFRNNLDQSSLRVVETPYFDSTNRNPRRRIKRVLKKIITENPSDGDLDCPELCRMMTSTPKQTTQRGNVDFNKTGIESGNKSRTLIYQVQKHLTNIEQTEMEQINRDLIMFQQARRRLMEDAAAMSGNKEAVIQFSANIK